MTDLELTKLAAEAVGKELWAQLTWYRLQEGKLYNPLTDPAQAFELQEKLKMRVGRGFVGDQCNAYIPVNSTHIVLSDWHTDLKRAITECAARYALWKRDRKEIKP